jgi:CRP-like cAMP-binding protein
VGESAALSDELHEADASAFTDSVAIVRVPREPFATAMARSGPAATELARMFGATARAANRRLAQFTSSSEERLASALMELGERFGDEMDDGSTLIPLRLTRAELAALVGTTVETTIRTLSRWSREGLVSTGEGRLTLHDARALALRSVTPTSHVRRGLEVVASAE